MRKLFLFIISVILLLSLTISSFALGIYTDISIDKWYYDAVEYVSENGVMVGVSDTEFAPDMPMNRAMAVTVLARLAGADLTDCTKTDFKDVEVDSWYGKNVIWAQKNGIVAGMSSTEFAPFDHMTREQMCVMLSGFFDYLGLLTPNTAVEPFADEDDISSWAIDDVARLHRGRIVSGKEENKFDPRGVATRAEIAQIVLSANLADIAPEEKAPGADVSEPETVEIAEEK